MKLYVSIEKKQNLVPLLPTQLSPAKLNLSGKTVSIDWVPNQPFASYFINEINMILPAGEFWFCRLYNKVLPQISDEKLKQDVQAFIRQEAMHAQAHNSANKEYLSRRNIRCLP